MKIKLLNLLNKILKKFAFLGFFSFTTSTSAQTTYQCLPCPEGTTSPAGSTSIQGCAPFVKSYTTSNATVTLSPGWYRISFKSANGSKGQDSTCNPKAKESVDSCSCGNNSYGILYRQTLVNGASKAQTATGGDGGPGISVSFLVYVAANSTATYSYNAGSPRLVIKDNTSGITRTYGADKGGSGTPGTCTSTSKVSKGSQMFCGLSGSSWYGSSGSTCASNFYYDKLETLNLVPKKGEVGNAGAIYSNNMGDYDSQQSSSEDMSTVGCKITLL